MAPPTSWVSSAATSNRTVPAPTPPLVRRRRHRRVGPGHPAARRRVLTRTAHDSLRPRRPCDAPGVSWRGQKRSKPYKADRVGAPADPVGPSDRSRRSWRGVPARPASRPGSLEQQPAGETSPRAGPRRSPAPAGRHLPQARSDRRTAARGGRRGHGSARVASPRVVRWLRSQGWRLYARTRPSVYPAESTRTKRNRPVPTASDGRP